MLRLRDDTGRAHTFYVVDVHHHIGAEGQTRNLNPKEPNGSYDFFRGVLYGSEYKTGLDAALRDAASCEYHASDGPVSIPHPTLRCLEAADERIRRTFDGTWAVDLSVAFPMHDDFRSNDEVEYRASNRRLSKITNILPNSLRFIPWGRVNPNGGDVALDELKRAVAEDGIRGLKLHPKSDAIDLDGDDLRRILREAALLDLVVIFHTDWRSDRQHIIAAVDDTIVEFARTDDMGAIGRLRVILGHFGWSVDSEMVGMVAHPCIYGEVSGLHGRGAVEFFQVAREAFDEHKWDASTVLSRVPDPGGVLKALGKSPTKDWSRKIMYGSDNPFLNQNNTIDVICAVLGRELDLTALEVANFLGLSALGLFTRSESTGDVGMGAASLSMGRSIEEVFSGTTEKAEVYLSTLLARQPSDIKRVDFIPVFVDEPHPRLVHEMGLLRFLDREGNTAELACFHLDGTGRTGLIPQAGGRDPSLRLGNPLDPMVPEGLCLASVDGPERDVGDIIDRFFISRFGDDIGGQPEEA